MEREISPGGRIWQHYLEYILNRHYGAFTSSEVREKEYWFNHEA